MPSGGETTSPFSARAEQRGDHPPARRATITPHPLQRLDGQVRISATYHSPRSGPTPIWYEVAEAHAEALSTEGAPYLLAAVHRAMREHVDVHVGGPVSPVLMANLEEWQLASAIIDSTYNEDDVRPAALTAEDEPPGGSDHPAHGTVVPLSGGIDSCFTLFRHTQRLDPRSDGVAAALFVRGWDIHLEHTAAYPGARARAERIASSLDVPLLAMATNTRLLGDRWISAHLPLLAGACHAVSGGYHRAVIASAERYGLYHHSGSSPATDYLLGSDTFPLVHDGAAFDRVEKILAMADWAEFLNNARFCWAGPDKDRNCGRCRKCLNTWMCFRVAGVQPRCFETEPDLDTLRHGIATMKLRDDGRPITGVIEHVDTILVWAERNDVQEPWVGWLRRRLRGELRRYDLARAGAALRRSVRR
jgi:hypothetical protein